MKTHLFNWLVFFVLFVNIECFASDIKTPTFSNTPIEYSISNNAISCDFDKLDLEPKMIIYTLIIGVYSLCWWGWQE